MKTSNNKLFDILKRNLGDPRAKEGWSHLIGENRTVGIATTREHVWAMCTASVRLSEGMFECWVTKANELKGMSKHPAFWV